jgi:Flp pilus assembly protein TadG
MTRVFRGQRRQRSRWGAGSAAVEFAMTAPLLVLLSLGAADYGAMMAQSSSLAAYARAGAEYARAQIASNKGMPSQATIQNTLNFPNGVSATFTATDPYCTCTDGTAVACPGLGDVNPCLAKNDPRVLEYVSITATQNFSPWISYVNLPAFPASLSANVVIRVR